jgi:hypothetical protein
MQFEHPDLIPDQIAAETPSGAPTLHKRTKTQRNELYLETLASHVLATVREGFAVAPALTAMSVLVVRREPVDEPGHNEELAAIYLGTFTKAFAIGQDWRRIDLLNVLDEPEDALLTTRGRTGEVSILDLSDEPEAQAVLEHLANALGITVGPTDAAEEEPKVDTADDHKAPHAALRGVVPVSASSSRANRAHPLPSASKPTAGDTKLKVVRASVETLRESDAIEAEATEATQTASQERIVQLRRSREEHDA